MLCFAEWDLEPGDPNRLAHLLAVLLQGQLAASGMAHDGNVRTPFSRRVLLRLLDETGWRVERHRSVDTIGLRDADWEVEATLRLEPGPGKEFLSSQLDVLRSVAAGSGNRPLPVYQLVATRGRQGS